MYGAYRFYECMVQFYQNYRKSEENVQVKVYWVARGGMASRYRDQP